MTTSCSAAHRKWASLSRKSIKATHKRRQYEALIDEGVDLTVAQKKRIQHAEIIENRLGREMMRITEDARRAGCSVDSWFARQGR